MPEAAQAAIDGLADWAERRMAAGERAVPNEPRPAADARVELREVTGETWRFMIDQHYQGRGYGRAAIAQVIEHARTVPDATQLLVSWVPANGGPEPLYRGLGFEPTGEIDDGEVVARLVL